MSAKLLYVDVRALVESVSPKLDFNIPDLMTYKTDDDIRDAVGVTEHLFKVACAERGLSILSLTKNRTDDVVEDPWFVRHSTYLE